MIYCVLTPDCQLIMMTWKVNFRGILKKIGVKIMETVVQKLEKKFPNSEIRIRDNKIYLYNPSTELEKYYGKFTAEFEEIKLQKSPLFKSSSWVNVQNPGIPGFSKFGKNKDKFKDGSKGLDFLSRFFILSFARIEAEELAEIEAKKSETRMKNRRENIKRKNISDTGNPQGDIIRKSISEIQRTQRCQEILLAMKPEKEKIIPLR